MRILEILDEIARVENSALDASIRGTKYHKLGKKVKLFLL